MKWEYVVEIISADKQALEGQLNKLGSDGWEVITLWSVAGQNQAVLLKRPKSK